MLVLPGEGKDISFCTGGEHNACIIPGTMSPHDGDTLHEKWSGEIKGLERSCGTRLWASMVWVWAAFIPSSAPLLQPSTTSVNIQKRLMQAAEKGLKKKKKKSHTRSIIPKNISSPLSSTFPQKHLQTTEKKLGFGFLPCLKPYHKSGFLQFLAFSSCHRLPQDTSYHSTKHLIIWTFPKAQMTFIDVAPKAQHVIAPCSFGSVS